MRLLEETEGYLHDFELDKNFLKQNLESTSQNKAGMAILKSDKVEFKARNTANENDILYW